MRYSHLRFPQCVSAPVLPGGSAGTIFTIMNINHDVYGDNVLLYRQISLTVTSVCSVPVED